MVSKRKGLYRKIAALALACGLFGALGAAAQDQLHLEDSATGTQLTLQPGSELGVNLESPAGNPRLSLWSLRPVPGSAELYQIVSAVAYADGTEIYLYDDGERVRIGRLAREDRSTMWLIRETGESKFFLWRVRSGESPDERRVILGEENGSLVMVTARGAQSANFREVFWVARTQNGQLTTIPRGSRERPRDVVAPAQDSRAARRELSRALAEVAAGKPLHTSRQSPGAQKGPSRKIRERRSDGNWECNETEVTVHKRPERFMITNPNANELFAGALLHGDSLASGTLRLVNVPRAGGVISIANTGGVLGGYRELDEVRGYKVNAAMNEILREYFAQTGGRGGGAAKMNFDFVNVESDEHMALEMTGYVNSATFEANGGFSLDTSRYKSHALVKFNQEYFTVSFEPPSSAAVDMLARTVTRNHLSQAGLESPATYISSVTYGRMFYALFESQRESMDLAADLSVAYNGVVNAGATVDVGVSNRLSRTSVKAWALGGDSELAAQATSGALAGRGTDKLKLIYNYLTQSANFSRNSQGYPISYVVTDLVTGKKVRMAQTGRYTERNCTPVVPREIAKKLRVRVTKFICDHADDEGPSNTVDIDRFWAWVNGEKILSKEYSGDGKGMHPDDYREHRVSGDTTLEVSSEDFPYFDLDLEAYVRDWDDSARASETGKGRTSLRGREITACENNPINSCGTNCCVHKVDVSSSDFDFTVEFEVSWSSVMDE